MYKYSKKAEQKCLSIPTFSFFFVLFAISREGEDFIYKKTIEKGEEHYLRQRNEI
jgi:hypothetical protein